MLDRVGIANQTTMLKGETQAIGKLFEKAMMTKFGPEALNDHFMVMDTICDATQVRLATGWPPPVCPKRLDVLPDILPDPQFD